MPETTPTNDVKIIAIKPCTGCHKDYLRVLKKDHLYYLCNDYVIDEKTDAITYTPSISENLFTQVADEEKIKVSISAIAGQNGSGKSSLIELLFMAVNNLAIDKGLNKDLEPVRQINVELFCLIGFYYKIRIFNQKISVFKYKDDFTLRRTTEKDFKLDDFFFTIAINYSLYAHNLSDIRTGQKDWLSGLFHKNDAYQTPLVINPKRDKGIIDINSENSLVKIRLIATLLRQNNDPEFSFRRTTDNLVATKLQLRVNRGKSKHSLYDIPDPNRKNRRLDIKLADLPNVIKDKEDIMNRINKKYPFNYKGNKTGVESAATDYLIGKMVSIAVTYDEYKVENYYSIEEGCFDLSKIDKYISQLLDDPSHIVFKFRQTLNFMRYPNLKWEAANLGLNDLSARLNKIISEEKDIKLRIEDLVPPPIFFMDILLAPIADTDKILPDEELIEFRTLSSGEKQMVYSISSVLYHLINLDSVRKKDESSKAKYKFVNIILEEVELYFHPEMQRCFIRNLLDSIRNVRLKTIKGINICFVTHSPFILSDIPDANVMFLKVIDQVSIQVNREEKTFGANIHDLLADGFFMENGFCGAYAVRKITETINFLEYHQTQKELRDDDRLRESAVDKALPQVLLTRAERERKQQQMNELEKLFTENDKMEHQKLIKSIGEPVLSIKLLEMYDQVFNTSRKEFLEDQIARLNEELSNINKHAVS
ncbi:AAA family ATPase [Mucilaginibacter gotjawali]|uniref:Energy-coupling factor transporter ATP-binding protein EcfA2 n=2 Tax=Mucilaginibacter gotjawali TaxID=1550579 RepID=A0A839SQX3_9SPHI|nr:AAA family ATPase [Mucilaginibacter gotjawali]MBB3058747.1 energy-coupling factor transporter ATP-binding protein EcfA2 [Mucilaginibacter gotjawali]BAU55649.1 hypothetical protein MgSA37_03840 [Mucilaginibacter gotjawali]